MGCAAASFSTGKMTSIMATVSRCLLTNPLRPGGNEFATSEVHHDPVMEMQVLVVDDEPMVREVLARYLERDGFDVRTAEDGAQALERFDPSQTGLVLLDLMLPRIDGLEVFSRLRSISSVPVIMLTARGEETDRVVGWIWAPTTTSRSRSLHARSSLGFAP